MRYIYIMGCGRSGTTLLLTQMTCFKDTYAHIDDARVPGEDLPDAFERLKDRPERHIVVKRASNAYELVGGIPSDIALLYLVRHPLDVLSSTLVYRDEVYENYIPPERWILEASALKTVLESGRPNVMVVRYESLVNSADDVQQQIAKEYGLEPNWPFSRSHEVISASKDIADTLNGVRPPSNKSIGRWKQPDRVQHAMEAWHAIGGLGPWFCERFGYDLAEVESLSRRVEFDLPPR